ncbi:hypothetical protein [Nonomuraea candida]|uniref:hypothetical protein n=1 Tax=Nonomuraea candida TaxID=359159 RepID=UPI000B1BCEF8|nr:hypothetical protein [Nonomuraea candida]
MTELDPDGRRLFLQLSADLYEQAIQEMHGDEPRNEGLAFWQAIREQMDAEEAEHKRRMTVYRMLEDLAVFRMAKVQKMPYHRIGARAGKSRTWAHGHTMPQDLVDDLIRMYAEAEAAERDAFMTAQTEPATPPQAGDRGSVVPLRYHPRRPAHEAARRSLLYRQLRRFLGGAAAVAGPIYVAVKTAAESYTTTVQTALMSNGALTPMPGLDPLSAGSLSGVLSATGTSGAAAQASGPVTTVVGKVVASAVIGVQATAGVSAPAAVAITAAAGTPVVLAAEQAAEPIAVALGIQRPDQAPAPAPDQFAALPAVPAPTEEMPHPVWQTPTAYETGTPSSSPTAKSSSPATQPLATVRAAAPTTAAVVPTATAPTTGAKTSEAAPTPTAVHSPQVTSDAVVPTSTPVEVVSTPVVSTAPPVASSPSPSTLEPTTQPTPTSSPTEAVPTPTEEPTAPPVTPVPDPAPTNGPSKGPDQKPDQEPGPAPTRDPDPTAVPEPTVIPSSPPQPAPAGGEQPEHGNAPTQDAPLEVLPAGAGGSVLALRPTPGWWY